MELDYLITDDVASREALRIAADLVEASNAADSVLPTGLRAAPQVADGPYGLHSPQGRYPASISFWRLPVNSCLLYSLMLSTELHEGSWNRFELVFST